MSRFLKEPEVIRVPDDVRGCEGAYIRLQDRKAVRDIQPNPDAPVFFYLDEDGYPVGIMFLAPVSGVVAFSLVHALMPEGVDQQLRYHFLGIDQIRAIVKAMEAAAIQVCPPEQETIP